MQRRAREMQKVWQCLQEMKATVALTTVWEGHKLVDAKKELELAEMRRTRVSDDTLLSRLPCHGKVTTECCGGSGRAGAFSAVAELF